MGHDALAVRPLSPPDPLPFPGKTLVLCCDGTCNSLGVASTNVARIVAMAEQDDRQIVYYDPGVGTLAQTGSLASRLLWKARLYFDAATAAELFSNVEEAYGFLVDRYNPGDRIMLFGFSRGAYTARIIAALVHHYGILLPSCRTSIPHLVQAMRWRNSAWLPPAAREIRGALCHSTPAASPLAYVGVWDTVASLGNPLRWSTFPYTAHNPSILAGRHAVSIDERRAMYRTNLWTEREAGQRLEQVWFAGAHADVGGGYDHSKEPRAHTHGLARAALEWVLAGATGLRLNPVRQRETLARMDPPTPGTPDHLGELHNELRRPGWWPLEFFPKMSSFVRARGLAKLKLGMNLFATRTARRFGDDAKVKAHASVRSRIEAGVGYAPSNLRNIDVEFVE